MLAYCDYIASVIKQALIHDTRETGTLIKDSGPVQMNLDENGVFMGTEKAITVWDTNGKAYMITIQETPVLDR